MKSKVQIETERPGEVKQVLEKSLETDSKVSYSLETGEQELRIKVETDGIGPLRGCTDTVFRLSSLALKLY